MSFSINMPLGGPIVDVSDWDQEDVEDHEAFVILRGLVDAGDPSFVMDETYQIEYPSCTKTLLADLVEDLPEITVYRVFGGRMISFLFPVTKTLEGTQAIYYSARIDMAVDQGLFFSPSVQQMPVVTQKPDPISTLSRDVKIKITGAQVSTSPQPTGAVDTDSNHVLESNEDFNYPLDSSGPSVTALTVHRLASKMKVGKSEDVIDVTTLTLPVTVNWTGNEGAMLNTAHVDINFVIV